MRYKVLKDGVEINTIIAAPEFIKDYCAENGFTFEEDRDTEAATTVRPKTLEQRVADLEAQLQQADDAAIELYEAQLEINAAQDDALIELYEMIGG